MGTDKNQWPFRHFFGLLFRLTAGESKSRTQYPAKGQQNCTCSWHSLLVVSSISVCVESIPPKIIECRVPIEILLPALGRTQQLPPAER